jgi:protein-L-isoaspartate(D-aspartate) O-methyltransferase
VPEIGDDDFDALREAMLDGIALHTRFSEPLTGRGAISDRVLAALRGVPRHEFVPLEIKPFAYLDQPLPIGCGKTISQPFIVALMTELLDVEPGDTVLEVGTGLGYQAAVLAALAGKVYSIEIIDDLAEAARARFKRLEIDNVEVRVADGARGWIEHAPFDKIIVTAAPDLIPAGLLGQLKPGGRMIVPTGIPDSQHLMLVTKDATGRLKTQQLMAVRFSELEIDDD